MIDTARFLLACRGRSRWPAERLRRLQEQRLHGLVRDAYERVSFYRRRFEEVGLTPDAVRTLSDLPKIPITTKDSLRTRPMAELVAAGIDASRLDIVRTSGSTGSPLRILRGPREVDWHRAAALRILRELGFHWTDRTLEIRALFGPTVLAQRLGVAPKRWVSILDPPEAQMRALLEYRPQVLCAAASTLHDLALAVLAAGVAPPPLRLVISDSEPLRPDTRTLVTRALRVAPIDVYGLVELSNFAWQCEERGGLYLGGRRGRQEPPAVAWGGAGISENGFYVACALAGLLRASQGGHRLEHRLGLRGGVETSRPAAGLWRRPRT